MVPTLPSSQRIAGLPGQATDELQFRPLASAVRIVCVSHENAGTKKGKQSGDQLGHYCPPPRLAMPGTALFKNSR
jgi:hypothetical protein